MSTLLERAEKLQQSGIHLGSPLRLFVDGGRKQLMLLLSEGLRPEAKVLDIGCGSLRAGYWLIHFLNRGCYFGLEPDEEMLRGGTDFILEPGLLEERRPIFDSNADLDFSVFGTRFSYFLARSVWTHAPKSAILKMLDGFVAHAEEGGVFLASYLRAARFRGDDYKGEDWLFVKSSPSGIGGGMLRHSFDWIKEECRERGLIAAEHSAAPFDFGGQTWLRIAKYRDPSP